MLGDKRRDIKARPTPVLADGEDTLEQYLENLSARILLAWDSSQGSEGLDFVRRFLTPDFEMAWSASTFFDAPFPYTNNREDHLKNAAALKKANPLWRVDAHSFSADVDYARGTAIVWFTSGATGDPGNGDEWTTNRESVSQLFWRRRKTDGEWECYRHCGIRGGGDLGDSFILPR